MAVQFPHLKQHHEFDCDAIDRIHRQGYMSAVIQVGSNWPGFSGVRRLFILFATVSFFQGGYTDHGFD